MPSSFLTAIFGMFTPLERIFVLNDICSIAVVCGGGSLIINGAVDEDWEADTMKIAGSENANI